MRKVLFEGYWFTVCKDESELKRKMVEIYGEKRPYEEYHHIFGRIGILKLVVENVIPINENYHRMQKAMKIKDRILFEDMVHRKIDILTYNRLGRMANYIKNINVLFGK